LIFTVLSVFIYAAPMVYTEHASPPTANVVVSLTTGNATVWNSITTANNDGTGTDQMYGQSFKHTENFNLSAISVYTPDTKNYGAGQTLQLAILKDANSDNAPDTLVGSVHSVGFTGINSFTPWKMFTLAAPVSCVANTAYAFVFTLPGPISDNMRIRTDTTGIYDDGTAINTTYTVGAFPEPLPPALNSNMERFAMSWLD